MKCEKCGFENEPESVFCGNCGDSLKVGDLPKNQVKICPSCRQENPPDAIFCQECGVDMNAFKIGAKPSQASREVPTMSQPIRASTPHSVFQPWHFVIMLVLATAIGGSLYYFFSSSMPTEASLPLVRPTEAPPKTQGSATAAVDMSEESLLFFDDFSDPASGWSGFGGPGESSEVGYQNGYYRMAFYQLTGFDASWSSDEYEDFTVETVFSTPANVEDVGAGFTLRTREKNWYLLWVYPAQGKYIFQKDINGQVTELIPLKESPVIRPLEQAGRLHLQLKVIARGDAFEIWVAQPASVYAYLDSVSDAELPIGHLGPSADCPDAAPDLPVEVLFDWIKISK